MGIYFSLIVLDSCVYILIIIIFFLGCCELLLIIFLVVAVRRMLLWVTADCCEPFFIVSCSIRGCD